MINAYWEHFEHKADIGVRGFGNTLAEAFEQAAVAMTTVVTDISQVQATTTNGSLTTNQVCCTSLVPICQTELVSRANQFTYQVQDTPAQRDYRIYLPQRVTQSSQRTTLETQ